MVTVDELNDMAYLPGEIANIDREIKALNLPPYSKCVTGCQRAECVAALTEVLKTLKERRQRSVAELTKLQTFMDGIKDPFTLELFQMRYVQRFGWGKIRVLMARRGFCYSHESLRQMSRRYLEEYNKNGAE